MELIEKISEITWLVTILKAVLLLAFTYLAVLVIDRTFTKIGRNKNLNLKFLNSFLKGLAWVIGVLQVVALVPGMSSFTKTLLAGSGIAAVVLGLAAQESFGNLISGMLIAVFHPFQVGDRIHLINNDITGFVEDITLRHTVIRTLTNSRIIIPNSEMGKEKIENADYGDSTASSFLDMSVAYESNLEQAMEVMAEVIGEHPLYCDVRTAEEKAQGVPKVKVFVREFGESGIMLRANMWTRTTSENFEACSDARLAIKKAFDEKGIEIPYNKVVVLKQNY